MPMVTAVIVAAGNSTRIGQGICKQLMPLCGKPVLFHTMCAFESAETINDIILVVREQDKEAIQQLVHSCNISKLSGIVIGGESRQQSVNHGIQAVSSDTDYIAIHDGARPLIRSDEIDAAVRETFIRGAVALAVPVKDTIKMTNSERRVLSTPERSGLWNIQTPQIFEADTLKKAMKNAISSGKDYTDDCQLIEGMGIPVYLYPGSYRNIKITTREDLYMAEIFMNQDTGSKLIPAYRIGHGYDVHRLVEGRKLIIGGVTIPYEMGLLGHSDADVLAHAIADALLGAAALGDIGLHFPDNDPEYEGADSLMLLKNVCCMIREHGYEISNIDATVVAQAPKLRPYISQMQQKLADFCGISNGQINIKATTEEGLGFTGHMEGISAHAVCNIYSLNKYFGSCV